MSCTIQIIITCDGTAPSCHGKDASDYLEMFWECLRRPLIEYDYDTPLETFVRSVFAPELCEEHSSAAEL